MVIKKEGPKITLDLTQKESDAIDFFIERRGPSVLDEYFGHFIKSRIATAEIELKNEVVEAFNKLTKGEQIALLAKRLK